MKDLEKHFEDIGGRTTTAAKSLKTKRADTAIKAAFRKGNITYIDVAQLVGVSVNTVQNWVNRNSIPFAALVQIYWHYFSHEDFWELFDVSDAEYADALVDWYKWHQCEEILFDQEALNNYMGGATKTEILDLLKKKYEG